MISTVYIEVWEFEAGLFDFNKACSLTITTFIICQALPWGWCRFSVRLIQVSEMKNIDRELSFPRYNISMYGTGSWQHNKIATACSEALRSFLHWLAWGPKPVHVRIQNLLRLIWDTISLRSQKKPEIHSKTENCHPWKPFIIGRKIYNILNERSVCILQNFHKWSIWLNVCLMNIHKCTQRAR